MALSGFVYPFLTLLPDPALLPQQPPKFPTNGAGKFNERDLPDYSGRDWTERAFTVGIGGYV